MTVNVKFFAIHRDLAGQDEVHIDCADGTDGFALIETLREDFPALGAMKDLGRFAVNCRFAPLDTVLQDHDEVTFVAPVSGG